MIEALIENPLLLLFIVSALGYAIGRVKIQGSSLGVAAVLFVGLAAGALDARLSLPETVFLLGLVIFVYTIGLGSGPGFFASFNRRGLRDNLFVLAVLVAAAGLAAAAAFLLQLNGTVVAGMFAGSLTNTPALAGVLDALRAAGADEALLAEPVIGYSIAYPMGVLGMIFAVLICKRLWKIDYQAESEKLRSFHLVEQELYNRTIRVTQPAALGVPLHNLANQHAWAVLVTRVKRGDALFLADADTTFQMGDLVNVLGAPGEVDAVTTLLGEPANDQLVFDRSQYDVRRIFVSNPAIAGRRLADLRLPHQHPGALITRVRQGDIDLLADGNTVLELGDRVRVVAKRDEMRKLSQFFGDSYKALSEINLLSFGLGVTLGLLLGLIPIPLPGGVTLELGYAGGPLLVALVLGAVRRTGPIVWSLPYSANLTLRQVGLTLLLAGIGVRSGYIFFDTFAQSGGLTIFLAAATITLAVAFLTLWFGYKVLKIPYPMLTGMLAALQTQPAVLGFSLEQSKNEVPNIGYALVFPIATIAKILLAQVLYLLLR
jgi:putative transport protein